MAILPRNRIHPSRIKTESKQTQKGNQDTYQELDATTNQSPRRDVAQEAEPIQRASEGSPVSGFIGAPLWLCVLFTGNSARGLTGGGQDFLVFICETSATNANKNGY